MTTKRIVVPPYEDERHQMANLHFIFREASDTAVSDGTDEYWWLTAGLNAVLDVLVPSVQANLFARLIAAAEADMQSEIDRFGEFIFDMAEWLQAQQAAMQQERGRDDGN